MAIEWYYTKSGQQQGPVNGGELKRLASSGQIAPTDLVWHEGMADWKPGSEVKGLVFPPAKAQPVGGAEAESPSFNFAKSSKPSQQPQPSGGTPMIDTGAGDAGVPQFQGTGRVRGPNLRTYPAMNIIRMIYLVLGWIVIVLGTLSVLLQLVTFLGGAAQASSTFGLDGFFLGSFFMLILVAMQAVFYALLAASLFFVAEVIRLLINIEHNTHEAAHWAKHK